MSLTHKDAEVVLTQISVYGTHKGPAVCKIMKMMCAYTKSRIQSQHVSNYTRGK